MEIEKDRVVTMHYTLRGDNGSVLDSSEGKDPLSYLHGHGNLIPGLETRIEGKTAGEEMDVQVPSGEAYGAVDPEKKFDVPRSQFPPDAELEPGSQFRAEGEGGPVVVRVDSVEGDTVKIDANHPLAGVDLNFKVKVVEVREATAEEIEHGHSHGAGGHSH
ncbi:FKBP-type peptidyl-prolyl cis-trans isomerase [Puniceicoccus vermicola]|uniref:Peptidyl-prolyl cis-trans isomerase n=1 Tax=Puniceicoccus vermicola TaxID=388746 RepID=A0A7X1E359_9BACT|nr:peptidylprolyl isomerase [Puniceicoccus vermicola]MBC2600619.1 peptidylprolyl isomerase [Puniceicoccus vermicola]